MFVAKQTNKEEFLMVIYWMRRWGRSSGTGGTAQGEAGTVKKNIFQILINLKSFDAKFREVLDQ